MLTCFYRSDVNALTLTIFNTFSSAIDGFPSSIIRRICQLVGSDVPKEIVTRCLDALHSYVEGPIDSAQSYGKPTLENKWHPANLKTKRDVFQEGIVHQLTQILDQNSVLSKSNEGILKSAVRLIRALSQTIEGNSENLVKMVSSFGFRTKLIALCNKPNIELPLLKSTLAALSVLCGQTLVSDNSDIDNEMIPDAVKLNDRQEVEALIQIASKVLTVYTSKGSSTMDDSDKGMLLNTFSILRFALPKFDLGVLTAVKTLFVNCLKCKTDS